MISYAKGRDEPIKDVRVGLNWTCVLSNNLGVAMYNIGWEIKDAGRLDEMTTGEVADLLKSWNLVEASVGLASINSTIGIKKGDNIIISTPRPFVPTLSFQSFYVQS